MAKSNHHTEGINHNCKGDTKISNFQKQMAGRQNNKLRQFADAPVASDTFPFIIL